MKPCQHITPNVSNDIDVAICLARSAILSNSVVNFGMTRTHSVANLQHCEILQIWRFAPVLSHL